MKAILVIDMPEACADGCPVMCRTRGINHRPSWCPLKPMPNRIVERGKWISEEYQLGWNACLEVINAKPE